MRPQEAQGLRRVWSQTSLAPPSSGHCQRLQQLRSQPVVFIAPRSPTPRPAPSCHALPMPRPLHL
jgi:hypothetical protein